MAYFKYKVASSISKHIVHNSQRLKSYADLVIWIDCIWTLSIGFNVGFKLWCCFLNNVSIETKFTKTLLIMYIPGSRYSVCVINGLTCRIMTTIISPPFTSIDGSLFHWPTWVLTGTWSIEFNTTSADLI